MTVNSPSSWDETIATFQQVLRDRDRADNTVATYGSVLRVFGKFYRDQLHKPGPCVESLEESDLTAFIDHLRNDRNLSDSSINRFVVALHSFCHIALDQRWHTRDVSHYLQTLRPGRLDDLVRLTPEEVQRFLGAVDVDGRNGKRNTAIVHVLLYTGVRVGELYRLNVGNLVIVDNIIRRLVVQCEAQYETWRKGRDIPLNADTRRALGYYLNSRNTPKKREEPLFLSERHQRMSKASVQRLVKTCLCAAGREELSTDDLRHHFAAQLYDATNNLSTV